MSVRIRLRRTGAKKKPFYRFVVADARSPRDGRFIEVLGNYNPIEYPAKVVVKEERIYYWLKKGAIPTETVNSLFRQIGLISKWESMKKGKDVSAVELSGEIQERKKKKKTKKRVVKTEAPEVKEEEAKEAEVKEEIQPEPEVKEPEEKKKEVEKKKEKPKEVTPETKKAEKEVKEEAKPESKGKKSKKKEPESKTEDSEKGKS